MAELHPQKENYLYSEVYNDSTKVTTITSSSTDVKYVDTDSGLCTRTTGHFDSSESHVVFDKGSYYLGVYHENFGTLEEDGGPVELAAISYRVNGISSNFAESYHMTAYGDSTANVLTEGTYFQSSGGILNIPRNTSNYSMNVFINTKQVYSNLICESGGTLIIKGAWHYTTSVGVSSGSDPGTVTPNGITDATKYPNIPATTTIRFQLYQERDGDSPIPSTARLWKYLDNYNQVINPEWKNQLSNGDYWSISVLDTNPQLGSAQIVSVQFEQGTEQHSRLEVNPNYNPNLPESDPNSNYYITVTYTNPCWFIDHCIVTVKGNSTKYGRYTGNNIESISTTDVRVRGGWTGQPNNSPQQTDINETFKVKVKDVHPKYDYSLVLIPNTANTPPTQTTETQVQSTLCHNSTRDVSGTTFQKTRTCTVMLSQRTCTGYVGHEVWENNWETASTLQTNFTWTSSNTNLATVSTSGVVTAHDKFAVADGQTTITVAINASTLNKQGIVYTATPYGGTKSSLTKTQDTKIFYILGRVDEYTWQLTAITPNPGGAIYDKDDTVSGHNTKTIDFIIYLQEQKNEGKTAEGGYTYQNSEYTALNKFTWTGDTNAEANGEGAIPVASTPGRYQGVNKNYYHGKKAATPGTIIGHVTAKPNFANNSVTKTDTLHKVYGTSNNIVKDYTTNVNDLASKTSSFSIYGYITYYTFTLAISGATTSGVICYNNSRSHYSPAPSSSVTFNVVLHTSYRSGKNMSGGYSIVTGPDITIESDFINWSSSPAATNYYVLSPNSTHSSCTCNNAHSRFNESDRSFDVVAQINTLGVYNIDSILIGGVHFTLTVLAREDEYTCGDYTVTVGSSTLNDGQSTNVRCTTVRYKKNDSFVSLSLSDSALSFSWTASQGSGSDSNAYITITSTGGTGGSIAYVQGVNKYYKYTKSIYTGAIAFSYTITNKAFDPRFTDNRNAGVKLYLNCYGGNTYNISVNGHDNVYKYEDLIITSPVPNTVYECDDSFSISTECKQYISSGLYQTNSSYITFVLLDGHYTAGVTRAYPSASFTSASGSTVYIHHDTNWTATSNTGFGVYVVWNPPSGSQLTSNRIEPLWAKPRPDNYFTSASVYVYDDPVGVTQYATVGGSMYVYKNNWTYVTSLDYYITSTANTNGSNRVWSDYSGDYYVYIYSNEDFSITDRLGVYHYISRNDMDTDWDSFSVMYYLEVAYSVDAANDHVVITSSWLSECYWDGGEDGWVDYDPSYENISGEVHIWYELYDDENNLVNSGDDYVYVTGSSGGLYYGYEAYVTLTGTFYGG